MGAKKSPDLSHCSLRIFAFDCPNRWSNCRRPLDAAGSNAAGYR